MIDDNVASIYPYTVDEDGHTVLSGTASYSKLPCMILRMSPQREETYQLGARVLGYDMHINQAVVVSLGDRVVDRDGVVYEIFGADIIKNLDAFSRLTIKREYVDPVVEEE